MTALWFPFFRAPQNYPFWALHLPKRGQEQECEAAHVLTSGADRQQVGLRPHAHAAFAQILDKVRSSRRWAVVPVESAPRSSRRAGPVGGGVGFLPV